MNLAVLTSDSPMPLPLSDPRGAVPAPLPDPNAFVQTLRTASSESREKALEAATSFVAAAFLMPVLATLHDSPFELSPPFAPGVGEQRFSPMLDQHLADRIAKASNFPLVESIVNRFAPASPSAKEHVNVRA